MKQGKFTNSFRSNPFNETGISKTSKKSDVVNLANETLGPVNHGYSQTYKGKLHMMSLAVSNKLAVSKSKLSSKVLSPKGHPIRAIHNNSNVREVFDSPLRKT